MFRILVVEDDESTRLLMCEVLRQAGYEPCPARDGVEALEVMDHFQCDLAIVDITMPRMDGIAFTQTLREGNCDLPVLMVTARVTQEDKRRGFRAGTDDYMVKPVDEEEMLWRVEALLRRCGFGALGVVEDTHGGDARSVNGLDIDAHVFAVPQRDGVSRRDKVGLGGGFALHPDHRVRGGLLRAELRELIHHRRGIGLIVRLVIRRIVHRFSSQT